MQALFRKLPFPVEFAIVLGGAFGYALVSSIWGLIQPTHAPSHSEIGMWRGLGVEALQFLVIGGFLRLRGWNGQRLGLQSQLSDGAVGIGLAIASYIAMYSAFILIADAAPVLAHTIQTIPRLPKTLSPATVAGEVLLGSFIEEFFVTGYIIAALKEKAGEDIAVNVSVALRLAYHLYQGVLGVLMVIPVGLIFSYWYAKTGRLWPVIAGHAALNLFAMAPYVKW